MRREPRGARDGRAGRGRRRSAPRPRRRNGRAGPVPRPHRRAVRDGFGAVSRQAATLGRGTLESSGVSSAAGAGQGSLAFRPPSTSSRTACRRCRDRQRRSRSHPAQRAARRRRAGISRPRSRPRRPLHDRAAAGRARSRRWRRRPRRPSRASSAGSARAAGPGRTISRPPARARRAGELLEALAQEAKSRGPDVRIAGVVVVEDEDRHDAVGVARGVRERGVVRDAQVAPEPVEDRHRGPGRSPRSPGGGSRRSPRAARARAAGARRGRADRTAARSPRGLP